MRTFTVSLPTPALPPTHTLNTHAHAHLFIFENAPVTRMTLPVRSGISLTLQVGFGGKDCSNTEYVAPMCSKEDGEEGGWGGREKTEFWVHLGTE
jgi:hypothetical protein